MQAANKNKKPISKGFTVTSAMVEDFKTSLKNQKVTIDDASFTKDEAFIAAMIKYDVDLALFGVSEARRNLIAKDPQAQFALSQFPDAVRLTDMARNRPPGGAKLR